MSQQDSWLFFFFQEVISQWKLSKTWNITVGHKEACSFVFHYCLKSYMKQWLSMYSEWQGILVISYRRQSALNAQNSQLQEKNVLTIAI